MMSSKQKGFPNLAFIQFAISMQGEYNIFIVIEFFSKAAPMATLIPCPGTTGNANTGKMFVSGGMPLQAGIYFSKGGKFFDIKIA